MRRSPMAARLSSCLIFCARVGALMAASFRTRSNSLDCFDCPVYVIHRFQHCFTIAWVRLCDIRLIARLRFVCCHAKPFHWVRAVANANARMRHTTLAPSSFNRAFSSYSSTHRSNVLAMSDTCFLYTILFRHISRVCSTFCATRSDLSRSLNTSL